MFNLFQKAVVEQKGKVLEDARYKHLMALSLDEKSGYKQGLIRCIASRVGDVEEFGYIDRSVLHHVSQDTAGKFFVGEKLNIGGEEDFMRQVEGEEWDCLGFEDPDIFNDPDDGLTHLYFTIPLLNKIEKNKMQIHLGHAEGKDLQSLKITMPVLLDNAKTGTAKEVSIAPKNSQGVRINLFESSEILNNIYYSVIRSAISRQAGPPWEFGEIIFHPAKQQRAWCAEHASPGPLFPKSFIDVGANKLLGIINGREASNRNGKEIKYGRFSPGLFIYNYEEGKIEWVADEPLFQDSESKTITFVSQFIQTGAKEGIVYAHVDDSFVRAYTLNSEKIKKLINKKSTA
jgi:hypothetical protein